MSAVKKEDGNEKIPGYEYIYFFTKEKRVHTEGEPVLHCSDHRAELCAFCSQCLRVSRESHQRHRDSFHLCWGGMRAPIYALLRAVQFQLTASGEGAIANYSLWL
jgi:hypothetical protein